MKVFDAHCDLLSKLFENKTNNFLSDNDNLQVTLKSLQEGCVKVQTFAIYIPTNIHPSMRFEAALSQANLFFEKVIKEAGLKQVVTHEDIQKLEDNEIGAMLALEGCDCIDQDILKLQTLLRMGVRSVGLTWNFANLVADGAMEPRGAGLSLFGRGIIEVLNENKIWCDVSHLSDRGFWDVIELADFPIASHSNSRALTPHPRNVTDEQFKALVERKGVVGINFHTPFLTEKSNSQISDVIRHIEHFCELGGVEHIGIGSDFDGTEMLPMYLKNPSDFPNLVNELLKYYSESEVRGFMYDNFAKKLARTGL
ncbi:MAG: rane dipeptidase [Bacillales bacterium]|nr:rane dipeptidase [Bacillales bacterium]